MTSRDAEQIVLSSQPPPPNLDDEESAAVEHIRRRARVEKIRPQTGRGDMWIPALVIMTVTAAIGLVLHLLK
ncbi:MAG: hypothetical protein AAGA23_02735 [Pseudomonadota bacterium]